MTVTIQTILLLLAVLVIVAVVARRLNIASSILLVAAGIALALIPGLPRIELAPELVLLGILPPLIVFGRRRHELAGISISICVRSRCSLSAACCSPPPRWRRSAII